MNEQIIAISIHIIILNLIKNLQYYKIKSNNTNNKKINGDTIAIAR